VHVTTPGIDQVPTWSVSKSEVAGEIGRLAAALTQALDALRSDEALAAERAGKQEASIFAVHRMYLQDPGALRRVEGIISDQRVNAEAAVNMVIEDLQQSLERMEGANVRSYAMDVTDPWRRVVDALCESERDEILAGDEKVVLAAKELTPQLVAYLDPARVLAVITEAGGRFSHGAVLARSMGFPTVTALPNLLARLEPGMRVCVDGGHGRVQLRPSDADVDAFLERRAHLLQRRDALERDAGLPALTPDGQPFGVEVNIASLHELDLFDLAHTDGVGLLRTEFLYMERKDFPSEEEQFRQYRRILEESAPRPVTLRLLDIGGDKQLPYFRTPSEMNPALGWRGIRITLQWRDLMRVQLRAILRASVYGNARILIPMVTSIEEVHALHEVFDELRIELDEQGYEVADDIPLGAMIEVPSSLITVEEFAREVDFISVGTNDLVQYLLAVDRDNPRVASLYDPQHPAVVSALARVAKHAREAACPCSVCGDMAGDPAHSVLLLGLGYDSVSVAGHFVPEIKDAVRRTRLEDARAYAEEVLAQPTSQGVQGVLSRIRAHLYDPEGGDAAISSATSERSRE